jgi:hypothetical protein
MSYLLIGFPPSRYVCVSSDDDFPDYLVVIFAKVRLSKLVISSILTFDRLAPDRLAAY